MRLVRRNFNRPTNFPTLWNQLLSDDFFYGKNKHNKACTPSQKWSARPAVNIKNVDNKYFIELAAPGFDKSDFAVELEDGLLTISAKKEVSEEKKDEGYTHKEFSSREFKRTFSLSEDKFDVEAINASYDAGILTVTIPQKELEETKLNIDVN